MIGGEQFELDLKEFFGFFGQFEGDPLLFKTLTNFHKLDIDDVRESPSLELIELLRDKGAKVDYNDPYIPATHKQRRYNLEMKSKKLSAAMLKRYDVVLIATNHSDYDYNWIVQNAKLIVDTRNATAGVKKGRSKIYKA